MHLVAYGGVLLRAHKLVIFTDSILPGVTIRRILALRRFGSMPRTRGGIFDPFDGPESANGGKRPTRGPRGRNQLEIDEASLDASALDYSKDDFEINEMVLARHPEHNEAWWPVILFSDQSQTKRKTNYSDPENISQYRHARL